MTPKMNLLSPNDTERIVEQAIRGLGTTGVLVENDQALALLVGAGQRIDNGRVWLTETVIRNALSTAPSDVIVYDRQGQPGLDLGGDRVHFDPGSAAVYILDPKTRRHRQPTTQDCAHLAWVTQACKHIAAQSTGLVPADVPPVMGDRIRLFIALANSTKPVITGTFSKDAFNVMRDMLIAVRGSAEALRDKPLAIFDCCPTPPLKWSDLTCQAVIDCAGAGIPVQFISMPLGGATAPVTLREMVVQHCAETLSGIVIHQLAKPGAPLIYGGCPSAFDMRHGTTPIGAIETMMVDVAYSQVGKHLGLPTHAYMALSDAKTPDWQAGAETAMGAILAVQAGINLVSGPGILDFIKCQSLEKLVLDNEACGAALRWAKGISQDSADSAVELLGMVVEEGQFLGNRHTRKNFRKELSFPGPTIDRSSYDDWERRGAVDAHDVAAAEVQRILDKGNPVPLADDVQGELDRLIGEEQARLGL